MHGQHVYGSRKLNEQFLYSELHGEDLRLELGAFIGSDCTSNDRTSDTTGASQCSFRGYKHIGYILQRETNMYQSITYTAPDNQQAMTLHSILCIMLICPVK